ncbi:unnamed protein product [Periconia digitata]|uniref:Uncharacterized protein n=1 Tax=Periconia digitata TaxID=1303443 RepID=A0A9W4XP31_9PLEO|nr:unnamed protein product [Periconia digitata]
MPAPLAKGHDSSPPSSSPPPDCHCSSCRRHPTAARPNHPLQTGLIIAASVLVAAGIAIYESPQVRQWVDDSRRKIAVALHSLGDELQPRRPSESSEDFENRKREVARRKRNELIRRAREEGVAVDLDALAAIGREEEVELAQTRPRRKTNASQRSFDDLVGSDGMLKKDTETTEKAIGSGTATENPDANLRKRGVAGFMAGAAAVGGDPFSDDHTLFDHDQDSNTKPSTRESTATIQDDSEHIPSATAGQLIDVTPESVYMHPDNAQTASIHQSSAPPSETEQAAQSFYSFTSDHSHIAADEDEEPDVFSTGTLTPRSEASAFTGASIVGSQASDIAILASMQNETDADTEDRDADARSEIFSESGFTEAGFSEAGFSEVGENRGILTPSSWTDVGSDDESEWGGPAQGGQVSQIQQQ